MILYKDELPIIKQLFTLVKKSIIKPMIESKSQTNSN